MLDKGLHNSSYALYKWAISGPMAVSSIGYDTNYYISSNLCETMDINTKATLSMLTDKDNSLFQ